MGEDGVHHCWEEDFPGKLEKVVLVEGRTRHECGAETLAAVFKFSPVILLGYEGDIVDEHQIEQAVDELCAIGTTLD